LKGEVLLRGVVDLMIWIWVGGLGEEWMQRMAVMWGMEMAWSMRGGKGVDWDRVCQ
jgi:hypothetical protein